MSGSIDRRVFLTSLGASAVLAAQTARPSRPWPSFTTRPVIMGRKGVVTAGHYLATAAGFRMLERGGNAFDAAAAMGFAGAVLEPQFNSLGGEVAILIYPAREKKVISISGQGVAPQAATIDWFRRNGIDPIPSIGLLPATVPAVPSAWFKVMERWGKLSVRDVLTPALELARDGYAAHAGVPGIVGGALKRYVTTRTAFHPAGRVPRIGEVFRMPALASTLAGLIDAADRSRDRETGIRAARELFYRGRVAQSIFKFSSETLVPDSTKEQHKGLLTLEDLASYETPIEAPVSASYRGYEVYKCGPWTQGPVFLQQLKLLEGLDLAALQHNSTSYIHTVTEAAKLAFADRDAFYGDPRFVKVPLDRLLSAEYAAGRRALIDPKHASLEIRPGPGGAIRESRARSPQPAFQDTTHLDAIDSEGNVIAATPSGGWIDMSPVIPDIGFPLGVRGQMFWLDPAHPNSLAPGKRPRTTITPSLVLRDGKPVLAFGTLGGDNQDQWTLQFFLNYVDFGMNLQEAIDAPSFDTSHMHSSWSGHAPVYGDLHLESRIPAGIVNELRELGHKASLSGDWSNGRVLAVEIDHENGIMRAAASPRAETGYAFGW